MKIVILNTSERTGGAAIAAHRLAKALRKTGMDVSMLVRDRATADPHVTALNHSFFSRKLNFLRFVWERLVIFCCNRFHRDTLFQVSIANTGTDLSRHPLIREADIIHLHWINQGFLSLADVKKLIATGKPMVWTLHDMWVFTGICHHAFGCEAFQEACGCCPFLSSKKTTDLSHRVFGKKQFLKDSGIHLVAVSSWLKGLAQSSALTKNLPVGLIPNVIDTDLFRPSDKAQARQQFSFAPEKKILLMGAARLNDPVKGIELLIQALSLLPGSSATSVDDYLLVLFGGIKGDDSFLSRIPIRYVSLGTIHDPAKIATLYAAADVTVVPSLYETFGQTIIEGMACGCPAVCFNYSGQTDIIDHGVDGYLARYKDPEDLARGIHWVLEHPAASRLREACVRKIGTCYSEKAIADKYVTLYTELVKNKA